MVIIFDLDGTLADCEHRRYFVDPQGNHPDYFRKPCESCKDGSYHMIDPQYHKITGEKWKPDWDAFYETCDQDTPITPVTDIFDTISYLENVHIWTGRCESVREKTLNWLCENIIFSRTSNYKTLKMRPVGDYTPDDVLKEQWLDAALAEGKKIEFVFDDRPKVIRMWRRRGIFVFNCAQNDEEF